MHIKHQFVVPPPLLHPSYPSTSCSSTSCCGCTFRNGGKEMALKGDQERKENWKLKKNRPWPKFDESEVAIKPGKWEVQRRSLIHIMRLPRSTWVIRPSYGQISRPCLYQFSSRDCRIEKHACTQTAHHAYEHMTSSCC